MNEKLPTTLLIVLTVLLGLGGGLYLYKQNSRGKYAATTKFQILQESTSNLFSNTPGPTSTMGANWLDNQIKLISSRDNLLRAVKQLHLETEWGTSQTEAVERLEKQVEVTLERGTEIVTVTVWSDKAQLAAPIANAIRTAYAEFRNEKEQEKLEGLTQFVTQQIELQKKKVETDKAAMTDLLKKHGITSAAPPGANLTPQNQAEIDAAKLNADSAQTMLNTINELSARQKVDKGVVKKPIEILEEARPPSP